MRKKITKIFQNHLFANSLIMIIGSNFANFLNYVYHLLVGRLLGPIGYGELAGILSLIGLLTILPGSFNLVVTKFISSTDDKKELGSLINWVTKFSFLLGGILAFLVFISSAFLTQFFNFTSPWLLIVLAISFLFSIPASYNRSILQGRLLFKSSMITIIAENFFKVLFGVSLIYLGWSTFGAVVGLAIANILGWLVTKKYLKELTKSVTEKIKVNKKEILSYTIPILIYSLATTSLYSSDVLLVKHYFSSQLTGIYASLSTLSKIIFFATGPIGAVMFPMVAKKKALNENYFSIFWWSLFLTCLVCGGVLIIYWLIPGIIVNLLYGSLFEEAKHFLFPISLSMALFAISSLAITFALSINRIKVVILPVLAATLQVNGIVFFHQDLVTVIYISLLTNIFLFISVILYILKLNYEKK